MSYPDVSMFVGGWCKPRDRALLPVINPATEETIGEFPCASTGDLERAAMVAQTAFLTWRNASALEREGILKKAAATLASWSEAGAVTLTQEHGKPLVEARAEIASSADLINWFAEK